MTGHFYQEKTNTVQNTAFCLFEKGWCIHLAKITFGTILGREGRGEIYADELRRDKDGC